MPARNMAREASRQKQRWLVIVVRSLVVDCSRFFLIIFRKRKARSVRIIEMQEMTEEMMVMRVRAS